MSVGRGVGEAEPCLVLKGICLLPELGAFRRRGVRLGSAEEVTDSWGRKVEESPAAGEGRMFRWRVRAPENWAGEAPRPGCRGMSRAEVAPRVRTCARAHTPCPHPAVCQTCPA